MKNFFLRIQIPLAKFGGSKEKEGFFHKNFPQEIDGMFYFLISQTKYFSSDLTSETLK